MTLTWEPSCGTCLCLSLLEASNGSQVLVTRGMALTKAESQVYSKSCMRSKSFILVPWKARAGLPRGDAGH